MISGLLRILLDRNFIFEIWSNDSMFNTLVMLRNMFDNMQMLDMKDWKLGPADRRRRVSFSFGQGINRDWNFR